MVIRLSSLFPSAAAGCRRRAAGFLLGASLLLSTLAVPPAAARVYDPETFTLANGMQVVVVTNRRAPVITHMVWYKTGAADEPRGKSGIAHFLEHLMFKGTDELAPGEFSRTVARNGGVGNAVTSWDYTSYYQSIARDRLELVMKMEADRMVDLRLQDEVVLPERGVIIEERRQRTDNNPSTRLWEQLNATLWLHHPYGTPIIGWQSEMEGLTTADALAWYNTWYTPNNAVLVVAGDITAKELKPLAEATYGKIPARPVPARVRVAEPPSATARRVVLADPQVRQPSWQRVWKAPSIAGPDKKVTAALDVLENIMDGGMTSRLYRSLVVEQKIAADVGMYYSGAGLDHGTVGLSASPVPDGDLQAVEAAMEAEVARLLKDGVTAEEVEQAKVRLRRAAIFARDSLQGPANAFGLVLTIGGTIADVEEWPERIAAVTVEDVNAAARAVLSQPGHVTGILLPDPAAVTSAAAAARPAGPTPSATAVEHAR